MRVCMCVHVCMRVCVCLGKVTLQTSQQKKKPTFLQPIILECCCCLCLYVCQGDQVKDVTTNTKRSQAVGGVCVHCCNA